MNCFPVCLLYLCNDLHKPYSTYAYLLEALTVPPCPDAQWECKASLPSNFRLGKTIVSCEGYDYPDDEFVSFFENILVRPARLILLRLLVTVSFSPDPAAWSTRFLNSTSPMFILIYIVLCSWNMNQVTEVLAPQIFDHMMIVVSSVVI